MPTLDLGGHRVAELGNAGRRGIAVVSVGEGLDRRRDDVIGRRKIRLADAEIDDVAPGSGKFSRPRQHGEGVFLANPVKGRDRFQHGLPGLV